MKTTATQTLFDIASQPKPACSASSPTAATWVAAARPVADPRRAYRGRTLLTGVTSLETDTWESGLNNNVLVLGCSGGGKTRHHVKPNLMQAHGSYVVLDCKGTLYREMGPFLRARSYRVDQLDFTSMDGTVGYNPLRHVRFNRYGRPMQQDIITIASAICPVEDHVSDPFWPQAAANYLAAYITYVFEALPSSEWTMSSVLWVFEQACIGRIDSMFAQLEADDPSSFAVTLYRRTKITTGAEKMHSSILGIIASSLMPFGFPEAVDAYERQPQVDFRDLGRERRALFVTMSDTDRSLTKLTSMFLRQAFAALIDSADHDYAQQCLPVPVRFVLDDFANLSLPGFDDMLSIIRSREISATIICQTVSQIEARYGEPTANSIIGNCDAQLVLAFQDDRTASYFSMRANKPASALLQTPAGQWWLFVRGQRGSMEPAFCLEQHPGYPELAALEESAARDANRERRGFPSVLRVPAPSPCDGDGEWYDFEELDLGDDDKLPATGVGQAGTAA